MDRKPLFDTIRDLLGRGLRQSEVDRIDHVLDGAENFALDPVPCVPSMRISPAGTQLIRRFEGCARLRPDGMVEAYPDPGSKDGHPWTIGYGATGPGIGPGTAWTREQCEARLERDLMGYAAEVAAAIGASPTTQGQFDALVSFHYNTGAIDRATLTAMHRRGDYEGARREFRKWVFNDGVRMKGLENRRMAEADLYGSG